MNIHTKNSLEGMAKRMAAYDGHREWSSLQEYTQGRYRDVVRIATDELVDLLLSEGKAVQMTSDTITIQLTPKEELF